MAPTGRARRDFGGLRQRRMRATQMFAAGKSQAYVANRLGVSRQSVSRWYREWKRGGRESLVGARRAGRKARLTPADLKRIEGALREGPGAHGFSTQLWTLPRVAAVIEKLTGVRYHPGHVWKILRRILGWSLQRPAKKAKERNDERIRRWVEETWPGLKKTRSASGRGSSSRTRAASPSVHRSGGRGPQGARHPS